MDCFTSLTKGSRKIKSESMGGEDLKNLFFIANVSKYKYSFRSLSSELHPDATNDSIKLHLIMNGEKSSVTRAHDCKYSDTVTCYRL